MTARPWQPNGDNLERDAFRTVVALTPGAVRRALGRGRRPINVYGGEFRVVRALLDVVAGLDPGAVRLAQTLLGLILSRRALRGAELSRRGGVGLSTRGGAR